MRLIFGILLLASIAQGIEFLASELTIKNNLTVTLDAQVDGNMTVGKGSDADGSAAFEIESTSLGFLPPRMSEGERDSISSPAEGLVIHNTATNEPNYFDGSSWQTFIASGGGAVGPNLIYNPEGWISQRHNPSISTVITDDNYGFDRWIQLSENANTEMFRSPVAPIGAFFSMQITKKVNVGHFGIEQILLSETTIPLRSQIVTCTLAAKTQSAEVSEIRLSILGWESTADVVTSDIVSSWASTPTYIANITQYGTTTLSLADSYLNVSLTTTVGASANNLIIFINTTNQGTSDDSIFISAVRCHRGSSDPGYFRRNQTDEIKLVEYFYQKSFDLDTVPGNVTSIGSETSEGNTSDYILTIHHNRMRAAGTVTLYNPNSGATGTWRETMGGGADRTVASSSLSEKGFHVQFTALAADAPFEGHWTHESEL